MSEIIDQAATLILVLFMIFVFIFLIYSLKFGRKRYDLVTKLSQESVKLSQEGVELSKERLAEAKKTNKLLGDLLAALNK